MSDNTEMTETSLPMQEPCVPDGIGLTVDDVRQLLFAKHDMSVPKDDPVLMMTTIMNAFLHEQSKLQQSHKSALEKFMNQQTAAYVKGVEACTAELTTNLSGVTIDGIRQATAMFAEKMGELRGVLLICTGIMALSALLNVAVFLLR